MNKIYRGKIEEGKLKVEDREAFTRDLQKFSGGWFEIKISKFKPRTKKQNDSIHLYCQFLADAFNEAGLDQRKMLKPDIEIEWNLGDVKEKIWRPYQIALLGKESTADLESQGDIDKIVKHIQRDLIRKYPGFPYIPFPFECKSCGGLSKHYEGCDQK